MEKVRAKLALFSVEKARSLHKTSFINVSTLIVSSDDPIDVQKLWQFYKFIHHDIHS